MSEHLVRIRLKNGDTIEIYKDDKTVKVCHGDHCVEIPKATGHQTLNLITLLEGVGEKMEFPEEDDNGPTSD